MKKMYFDIRFLYLTTAKGINRYIEKYLEYTKLSFSYLDEKKVRPFSLLDPFYLMWEIKSKKIRFLIIPSINLPLFNARAKIVTIVMDFISYDMYKKRFFSVEGIFKRIYYGWFLPWKLRRIAAIITISEFSKQQILLRYKKIDPKKIHVAYPGLDENTFNRLAVHSERSIPNKYFFSMFSNDRVIDHKNIDRVVEAFSAVAQTHSQLELVILGDLSVARKEKLIQLNKSSSQIHFIKSITDKELVSYYRNAVAFVYPSLMEGFGMPIIEAMACACPVITSNVSSMPEVAGNAALLVNPYDVQEISDAMSQINHDSKLRESLISRGVEQAAKFSWTQTAKVIDRVINEVLG